MAELFDMGLFRGLVTLTLLSAFVGVVVWAWSSKRKADFDEAARLPLEQGSDHEGRQENLR